MTAALASILLFLRHPAPGRVKSRLAAVLGDDAALELYRCFVLDILDAIELTGRHHRICVHPPDAIPAVSAWLGAHRSYLPQTGADLGERMEQAFRAEFTEGRERAILIGSDIPDLPALVLHEALDALDRHDAVIGPARDGGYYLIGFRREEFVPSIFRNIAWSRQDVFERTMAVFRRTRSPVHVLRQWQDVDTLEDLRDLRARSEGTLFSGSRTMACLADRKEMIIPEEEPHA